MSYYITIELELYPGTDVGKIKKYAMKCNNTFEKIRKSLAELFNYQYRPKELKEAYGYEMEYDANEKLKEEQARYKEIDRDKEREQERDRGRDRDKERDKEQNRGKQGGGKQGGGTSKKKSKKKNNRSRTLKVKR